MYDLAFTLESYTIPEYEIATEGINIGGIITRILSFIKGKVGVIIGLIVGILALVMKSKVKAIKEEASSEAAKIRQDCEKLAKVGQKLVNSMYNITRQVKSIVNFIQGSDKAGNVPTVIEALTKRNNEGSNALQNYKEVDGSAHELAFLKVDEETQNDLLEQKKYLEDISKSIDWIMKKHKVATLSAPSSEYSNQLNNLSKVIGTSCNLVINGYTLIKKRIAVYDSLKKQYGND